MSVPSVARPAEVAFLARHGVHAMKNSDANIMKLFRSAGASPTAARRAKAAVGLCGARHGAFDHGRLFGRDHRPTLLVGHPYGLDDRALTMIAEIRALGLTVQVNGPRASFYNTITCQVLVFAGRWPGDRRDGPAPTPRQGNHHAASSPHHTDHGLAGSNLGADPPPH